MFRIYDAAATVPFALFLSARQTMPNLYREAFMRAGALIAIAMIGTLLSVPVNAASWSDPTLTPTAGPPWVIGAPSNGCIGGAQDQIVSRAFPILGVFEVQR